MLTGRCLHFSSALIAGSPVVLVERLRMEPYKAGCRLTGSRLGVPAGVDCALKVRKVASSSTAFVRRVFRRAEKHFGETFTLAINSTAPRSSTTSILARFRPERAQTLRQDAR